MRRFWDDPLVPARLTQAQGHQEEFRRTRIAAEIAEDLRAALEQFEAIAADLAPAK